MTRPSFRFLHASDLHLDRPVHHLAEQPEHLETRFQQAAQQAARRLFQLAVTEEVDFVILSGGVLAPLAAGPGTLVFLVEQFQKLREAGILVYWAGSFHDRPEEWPAAIQLPDNVHVFRTGNPEEYIFLKKEVPTVRLVGMSRSSRRRNIRLNGFSPDPAGLFSIAVANGIVHPAKLTHFHFQYWAVGGTVRRKTYFSKVRKTTSTDTVTAKTTGTTSTSSTAAAAPKTGRLEPYIVHYPGATVGRQLADSGVFGVTLVEVLPNERPVLRQLPTAPIRWRTERITVDARSTVDDLRAEMKQRLKNIRSVQTDFDVLLQWVVQSIDDSLATGRLHGSPLITQLRNESFVTKILEEQRAEYGLKEPMLWPFGIEVPTPDTLKPNLYEQRTILGDFLRSVHHHQSNPTEAVSVQLLLPPHLPEKLEGQLLMTRVTGTAENGSDILRVKSLQSSVLKEVAMLGNDLLGAIDAGHGEMA